MPSPSEPRPAPAPGDLAHVATATVLDATALAKLRELDPGGRAGVLPRVLQTFESSTQRLMVQFNAARATQDLATLRYVAHTVRSSSASVGALALSACCLEVETRIRDGRMTEPSELMPALDAMAAESQRAGAAVRAMLTAQGKPE